MRKVTVYLCESWDEHLGKWKPSRHYYTLEQIAGFANSRPIMESAREEERAEPHKHIGASTGFPGPKA